jgi:hypothetical protein
MAHRQSCFIFFGVNNAPDTAYSRRWAARQKPSSITIGVKDKLEEGETNLDNYYLSRKSQLLGEFDRKAKKARRVLALHYGRDLADGWGEEIRQEYMALIPGLPYIGGDKNPWTDFILTTAQSVAIYRVMTDHGRTLKEVGETLYSIARLLVGGYPKWLLRLLGRQKFTKGYIETLKKRAKESEERRYPGDWVFRFVEGDGMDFDYGVDIIECGACKYAREHDAEELSPYFCLGDYPLSDAFGWGLVRTMTIAEGAKKCDFRLKRGRKLERKLPFDGVWH